MHDRGLKKPFFEMPPWTLSYIPGSLQTDDALLFPFFRGLSGLLIRIWSTSLHPCSFRGGNSILSSLTLKSRCYWSDSHSPLVLRCPAQSILGKSMHLWTPWMEALSHPTAHSVLGSATLVAFQLGTIKRGLLKIVMGCITYHHNKTH